MQVEEGLFRSSAQISAVTAVARVLGFARWIVFGATVGATYLGNVYQTTNWIPNILFELAAGGLLSSVFVPTFVEALQGADGSHRAGEIASSLANFFLLLTVPVVITGILLGRPLMRALTAGVDDPAVRAREIELGAWFLRFFLPQVPMYFLGMVARSVLHANRRFVAAAAAPAVSSLTAIGAYIAFRALGPGADLGNVSRAQLYVLALGTTGGIVAWTAVQAVPAWRLGYAWRPVLRWSDDVVRRAIRGAWHGGAYFAVTEIGVIVTLILANRVKGGVVAWQLAFAFYEVPNALAALPVSLSLAPALAAHALRKEEARFAELLSRGWRGPALLVVPAAAGLIVLSAPLAEVVLRRGTPELLDAVLGPLAAGLPAFALTQSLVRAWYSRLETRPPVAVNAIAIGAYCAGALGATAALSPRGPAALAVLGTAHSAGQWLALFAAVVMLGRHVGAWRYARDLRFLGAAVVRSALMAAVVWGASRAVEPAGPAVRIVAGLAAGVVAYGLLSSRVPEVRGLTKALRERV